MTALGTSLACVAVLIVAFALWRITRNLVDVDGLHGEILRDHRREIEELQRNVSKLYAEAETARRRLDAQVARLGDHEQRQAQDHEGLARLIPACEQTGRLLVELSEVVEALTASIVPDSQDDRAQGAAPARAAPGNEHPPVEGREAWPS